ncbi:MAG: hypothetical protein Q9175_004174 [Cornicularia normoerica]
MVFKDLRSQLQSLYQRMDRPNPTRRRPMASAGAAAATAILYVSRREVVKGAKEGWRRRANTHVIEEALSPHSYFHTLNLDTWDFSRLGSTKPFLWPKITTSTTSMGYEKDQTLDGPPRRFKVGVGSLKDDGSIRED